MRADQRDDVTIEAKIPCAACGCEPKTSAEVWGQRLCYPCINAWNAEAPNDAAWDAVPAAGKKMWTNVWCEAQRTRAA
jgi:hypothetical protein